MIQVFQPNISLKDKISVLKSLSMNQISGTSPVVKEFEEKIAKDFDRKFGIAVSSGSSALDVALSVLDLKEGDEVILPSFTIISCLAAVIRSEATPIFCDVDNKTWNMNVDDVKTRITTKTRAIIMVHTYGLTSPAKDILDICKAKNIILIEDAAEAHGQIVDSQRCGSFGQISTLSFYANKHITTGEGGMVLTNDINIYNKSLRIRNLDFGKPRFIHKNLFWNYRMSSIQAALGISQLKDLNKTINKKIAQGTFYLELLKDYQHYLDLPLKNNGDVKNNFWVFGLVLKFENSRDQIIEDLLKKGIETRPFFWPLHLQPALPKKFVNNNTYPVSEWLGRNGLYLPIGSHINKNTQKLIVKTLIDSIEKSQKDA
tara:strand:- start:601 stop:1719 length:1119 start_codon:yes stop_codon:yes gene_type:complete